MVGRNWADGRQDGRETSNCVWFFFFGFFSYMNILPIQILILEVFLSVNLTLYNLKY